MTAIGRRTGRAAATVTPFPLAGATTTLPVPLPAGQRRLALVVANPAATAGSYQITVTPR